jgi:ATP-dependent Lon protease
MSQDHPTPTERLPLVALRGLVVLPNASVPLFIGRHQSVASVKEALQKDQRIVCVTQRDSKVESPELSDLFSKGTVATIVTSSTIPDGSIRILVTGEEIVEISKIEKEGDLIYASFSPCIHGKEDSQDELNQLVSHLKKQCLIYLKLDRKLPKDKGALERVKDPERLIYLALTHLSNLSVEDKYGVLDEENLTQQILRVLAHLEEEIQRLQVDRQIHSRVKKQMERDQRDYYLNEKMKAIQRELGGREEAKGEQDELDTKIADKDLPDVVREKLEREAKKLKLMSPMSAEATVVRNYVEWILSLPWRDYSDEKRDLVMAENILNEDHYALKKPKERILEHLAVHSLISELKGPILCLVGPPGVGKTSLARSIARCTGREFVRMSLGGVRDEAEIRGHRRTYIGAMPGKIIHSLKKVGTNNPVILLDEIDKMSTDFRGDPSSALLEVLDPEQNNTFNDHYVDLDYDLSQVMFITTANNRHQIPLPLQDRLEMIEVSGYTELEKLHIIKRHLLPKQVQRHGIAEAQISWGDSAIKLIINRYTRESGVRNLERQIAAVCRKIAREVISHKDSGKEIKKFKAKVDSRQVQKFLGPPPYKFGVSDTQDEVGLVNGLAYTSWGGNLLQAECTVMEGNGKLTITGQLGEVMQESARAAMSYVRSRASDLGLEPKFYQNLDIHMHFPEGAIPKDGPSAGVTMATGLISSIKGLAVRKDVAMTGEITLRGRVLPIGGLKEKLLAAKRGGIKTVFIPSENEKDLIEIPSTILRSLEVICVEQVDEILAKAYVIDGGPWKETTHTISPEDESESTPSISDNHSTSAEKAPTTAKKATPKKATPKKATPKKATPKKATPKKATPKKPTAKKPTTKKTPAKKKATTKKNSSVG